MQGHHTMLPPPSFQTCISIWLEHGACGIKHNLIIKHCASCFPLIANKM